MIARWRRNKNLTNILILKPGFQFINAKQPATKPGYVYISIFYECFFINVLSTTKQKNEMSFNIV